MRICTLIATALVGCSTAFAAMPYATAKARYDADVKKATQQYETDKKVCADETDVTARLQCRRDAKTSNDQALQKAKANMNIAMTSTSTLTAAAPAPPPAETVTSVVQEVPRDYCADCATVSAVSVLEKLGQATPLGLVAGGVGGGILGHQLGGGIGRDLATLAGVLGGAYAGKDLEEKTRSLKVWTVTVQYPDNSKRNFEFKEDPKYKVGDQVKNAGTSITRR